MMLTISRNFLVLNGFSYKISYKVFCSIMLVNYAVDWVTEASLTWNETIVAQFRGYAVTRPHSLSNYFKESANNGMSSTSTAAVDFVWTRKSTIKPSSNKIEKKLRNQLKILMLKMIIEMNNGDTFSVGFDDFWLWVQHPHNHSTVS